MDARTNNGIGKQGETRAEAIYRALFDAILAQELIPGTKLNEETLGTFFNVSRTVVRAALTRLHTESLIELKQNRGAFVASPTIDEARQVFEARVCVEKEVASQLARAATEPQLKRLAQHIKREETALKQGDMAASIRLSGEFHLLAAQIAGNEVLARFLSELVSRTSLILAIHGRQGVSECGIEEHREILTAVRNRDADKAAKAMVRHLGDVVDRIELGTGRARTSKLVDILARYSA